MICRMRPFSISLFLIVRLPNPCVLGPLVREILSNGSHGCEVRTGFLLGCAVAAYCGCAMLLAAEKWLMHWFVPVV